MTREFLLCPSQRLPRSRTLANTALKDYVRRVFGVEERIEELCAIARGTIRHESVNGFERKLWYNL
jgi:hypothetical protein